jgi:meso-butanediol dehydrogenase/(S,S)-butanediol dehydrogenase/diacetyl reductase
MSTRPLEGKVALVTGGARGIGAGVAEVLVAAGARIAIGDLVGGQHSAYRLADTQDLDETLSRLTAAGGQPFSIHLDVSKSDSCNSAAASVLEHFGRLDILVNNAGIVRSGPITELSEEDWDQMFAVNTKSIFLMSRAVLPALRESEGAIVNIASVAGLAGHANMSAYCGSKFAAIGITQSLAHELAGDGIRVNAVCPGVLATAMWLNHLMPEADMKDPSEESETDRGERFEKMMRSAVPLGRPQTPADIGEAVLYLATAPNVTGIAMPVAGGSVMR